MHIDGEIPAGTVIYNQGHPVETLEMVRVRIAAPQPNAAKLTEQEKAVADEIRVLLAEGQKRWAITTHLERCRLLLEHARWSLIQECYRNKSLEEFVHAIDVELAELAASPPAQAQELEALKAWRDSVTAALRIEGGCRFEDVPRYIKVNVDLLNQFAEALGVGDGDCDWDATELLETARKAGDLLERSALPPAPGWQEPNQ